MLTLNSDKTKLMVTTKARYRKSAETIKLRASKYIIEQVSKIKVLGIFITNTLDNQANINNIVQKVNYRTSLLRGIFRYCKYRTKHILSTSIILSIFRYAAPILIDCNKIQLRTLQTLLLKTTRPILGFNSYKWNTSRILGTLKWPSIYHLIISESLKFIHKPIYESTPPAIINLFDKSLKGNSRKLPQPYMNIKENSEYMSKSIFYQTLFMYRLLPDTIRNLNPKKFSKSIYDHLKYYWDPRNIPYKP